jgi:putative pyruvate formate lyase activating enzyme
MSYPSYVELYQSGELEKRVNKALEYLKKCVICPRSCKADRWENEKGECGVGRFAVVSSFGPHFGEEPPLVGRYGSGTVFFSGCNLHCVFCQNYEISQLLEGRKVDPFTLAEIFLEVQKIGCHNLNLVSPTHVVPQILEALLIAIPKGLRIPIVYNTGGYDSILMLKLLNGIVDIYMPDTRYSDSDKGKKYSDIDSYFEVSKKILKEMHTQVGDLVIKNGVAVKGLLIRHLVLPERIAGSFKTLDFIAKELSLNSYINIMDQYRPCYKAYSFPELSRRITRQEYQEVVGYAKKLGFKRGIPFDYNRNRLIL